MGIVGLGGLGHIAIKLAHAMGAHVVLFTTSSEKVEDVKMLGANEIVISKNAEVMKAQVNRFDFIMNTASRDLAPFLNLSKARWSDVLDRSSSDASSISKCSTSYF